MPSFDDPPRVMPSGGRPDPDALLARVQADEVRARRGKLKVFFGAAAGVGKTYTMLEAAQRRKADGVDVVVGYVEPHGRADTERLLEGLERIPFAMRPEGQALVREFDLDAALARRPALLLVDELAHTNAPGSRHVKRWQDIEELRDAGVDVWSTVNVQHLESLNDVVAGITGVRMQETVPDTVFESADEVELVDLSPDDLLQRIREGKVYVPERARVAIENFFRKGNLIALRELALRKTAERVDAAMDRYRSAESIRQPWAAGERVLVAVGPRSDGESLVRAGRRLAQALHATWLVVYVETPDLIRLPEAERNRRIAWLRLAESLGAETVTLGGHSAGDELVEYARTRNATRVLMGEPSRSGWRRWLRPSAVDRVLGRLRGVDITVVKSNDATRAARNPVLARTMAYFAGREPTVAGSGKVRWPGYAWSAVPVALATAFAWVTMPALDQANVVMIYLLAIAVVAWRFGRGPSVLASIASTLAYNFFFVPPRYTLDIADGQYLLTFAVLMSVGLLIATLMTSVRLQARVAGHRERRTALLYAMSRELSVTRGVENLARVAVSHIGEVFEAQAAVLLPDAGGRIVHPGGRPELSSLRGADLSVAQWAFDHGRRAGLGTDTLPGSAAQYLPLLAAERRRNGASESDARRPLGVLAVLPANPRRILLPEQAHLLETFAGQLALALERAELADAAQSAQVEAETESVRNSLLAAISHDMRTPLAVISGAASGLLEGHALPRDKRDELARSIVDEAGQMTQLVANVLDMTRLQAGRVELRPEWTSLEELAGSAARRLQSRLAARRVEIDVPADAALVRGDPVLLEQLLFNLLENAARHTPPDTRVRIAARRIGDQVEMTVADDGPGFPEGVAPSTLFEKFQRGRVEGIGGGVGLGLAICRAIVQAHGGEIGAERIPAGGALFTIVLPQPEPPPVVPAERDT